MELISDKIKIEELLKLKRSQMLTVNPEYQRGAVWNEAQQKRLIDSVLRGYPLPLIYLHYKKVSVMGLNRESLEIIDGQQRINALHAFAEGGFKLFDPVKDDKKARFPEFIKNTPCPWARCDYFSLSQELRKQFDETELFIVRVTTENEDEARDLFIRLQSGLPLNAQEKGDAWPGGYTEFTLRYGGKYGIARYPGHDFFRNVVYKSSTDRGDVRTLCAQLGMLFFSNATEGNWLELSTQAIDDYYYQNLGFDVKSQQVNEFSKVLDAVAQVFEGYKGPKLKVHEAIHVTLLIKSLIADYVRSWQDGFITAFDKFREQAAIGKKLKDGEYWYNYGALTMTQATSASSIQRRHSFFSTKMIEFLQPVKKDATRVYGQLEREIIYFRDRKLCAVCDGEISWSELEIHHLEEHQNGGQTTFENGVAVHKECHPRGDAAIEFKKQWEGKKQSTVLQQAQAIQNVGSGLFKIDSKYKNILAYGKETSDKKFMVLKGSTVSPSVSESFAANCPIPSNKRKKYYREGVINSENTFTEDIVFNTKSGAASLIFGYSANGNTSWVPASAEEVSFKL